METLIYEKLGSDRVRCGICNHFCTIDPGGRGLCHVRENRSGTLESLVYGTVVARAIDPVEKKPIFHLKPGSTSYSIATVGCNFNCSFCQNSQIARMPANLGGLVHGVDMTPEAIVAAALKAGCASISYTYTEPTVYFEFALDTAKIAKQQGLLNIFVTNGFMTSEVIRTAAPFLDAANVDLKAFDAGFYTKYCKAKLTPVKENLKLMKSLGILVEVTTLLIPGLNDSTKEIQGIVSFIADELGVETPWHVSAFHPSYKMTDRQRTPVSTLKKAWQAGIDAGLRYVYAGNAPGLGLESTCCHACGTVLVKRQGYTVDSLVTPRGCCPDCDTVVYGKF